MKGDFFLFVMFTSRHDLEHLTQKKYIDVLGQCLHKIYVQIQLNGVNTLNTIADGSVLTAKIADGNVTLAKLNFDPEDDATALAIALG